MHPPIKDQEISEAHGMAIFAAGLFLIGNKKAARSGHPQRGLEAGKIAFVFEVKLGSIKACNVKPIDLYLLHQQTK